MRRTTTLVIALSMAVSGLSLLPAAPAVAAGAISTAQPTLVSADPADWTPNIQDGQVNAIVQVGNQVIVGGQFLQAKNIGGNLLDVSSILAFDATTGAINKNFMPTFDGEILALGTDGTSVYVGGRFATVNGQTGYKRLVKLDPANGQIVTQFKAKIGAGEAVHDMSFANGKLYIGGAFSAVQGVAREKFAALNPVSGVLDPTVDVAFTGKHNGGTGRIRKFDITPDGTKMVAVGNFTLVDGQDRDQAAMVDLTTDTVANWQTNRFKSACSSFFDTYTNDVDISPDGSYFVIGTTGAFMGGANAGVLCDTTSRWEINATGTALQPTWVDYTGGDTTFSVTATNTAVYVGGHQRWWNNPYSPSGDAAGQGAIDRMGIASLDPLNGLPFSWNPIRDPRGLGVQMMLATPAGLWVGSDTSGIGGEYHGKIAFMPLAGGASVPAPYVATLPNDLYTVPQSGCLSQDPSVLYRVNAGGSLVPSGNCQIDWAVDTSAAPSLLHNTGASAVTGGTPTLNGTVPPGTPIGIFSAAREDPIGGNEMQWNFNVPAGKQVKVRMYFANFAGNLKQTGQARVQRVDRRDDRAAELRHQRLDRLPGRRDARVHGDERRAGQRALLPPRQQPDRERDRGHRPEHRARRRWWRPRVPGAPLLRRLDDGDGRRRCPRPAPTGRTPVGRSSPTASSTEAGTTDSSTPVRSTAPRWARPPRWTCTDSPRRTSRSRTSPACSSRTAASTTRWPTTPGCT